MVQIKQKFESSGAPKISNRKRHDFSGGNVESINIFQSITKSIFVAFYFLSFLWNNLVLVKCWLLTTIFLTRSMLINSNAFPPGKETTGTHLWAGWHFSWKKSYIKVYPYFTLQFFAFTNIFIIFLCVLWGGKCRYI